MELGVDWELELSLRSTLNLGRVRNGIEFEFAFALEFGLRFISSWIVGWVELDIAFNLDSNCSLGFYLSDSWS